MQHQAAQDEENHDGGFTVEDYQGEFGDGVPDGRHVLDRRMEHPTNQAQIGMKDGMVKNNSRCGEATQAIQLTITGCFYRGLNIIRSLIGLQLRLEVWPREGALRRKQTSERAAGDCMDRTG